MNIYSTDFILIWKLELNMMILESNINEIINSFCEKDEFLFTGIICKSWKVPFSKYTSLHHVIHNVSRLEEYFNTGGSYSKIAGIAISQGYDSMTILYDNYKLYKIKKKN